MAFKMHCPKCFGLDYSIERDNRTFGAVAQAFELVFHCRCGKQMFGEQLVKEYDTQKADYDLNGGADDEVEAPGLGGSPDQRVTWLRPVENGAPAGNGPAQVDEALRRADEDRRWRERVQTTAQEVTLAPAVVKGPVSADVECAWPGCEKPQRPNSKYCSRACSNKNARARHKARQKKTKKSLKAASL